MSLTISLSHNESLKTVDKLNKDFTGLIHGTEYGFYHVNIRHELIETTRNVYKKFSHKKFFVQVGIGGSSLGPEMLVSALKKSSCHFTFLDNIDPEFTYNELKKIDIKKALFFVVSKSGGTAETMANFAIIASLLKEEGIDENQFKDYFVFATDPLKSDLLNLGRELNIDCLEVPSNVGGRFCVMSPVGFLPALFAGIDIQSLVSGAEEVKSLIESDEFFNLGQYILEMKAQGINQTVMMPYSSKLKSFSAWFVQLWAESLGKKTNTKGALVNTGLTPIASYGATDQHSQVQLFMEGPKDKLIFFIEVNEFTHDFSLENSFSTPALKKLSPYKLSQLMKAELKGTQKALQAEDRPFISCTLPKLDESSLGGLIVLCECLTAYVGLGLSINPFDQPGVEMGKKYAFEWLDSL